MPQDQTFADHEVAEFLEKLPRHLTYTQMAEACARRFGRSRAWSRSKIGRYWILFHPPGKGRPSCMAYDPEVEHFVEDRLGRMTLDALVKACVSFFGEQRAPSRSALHRRWQQVRQRATL